eukprot:CAMPEP_0194751408 /NCGR_PEP_ID=MMETSP0323_2-20130528/5475_1 /TAXON_ID=2866 ORGANISM="Crypthecodinium cohnii, Strain Seligo" /NCGR_SAMPLE_ID=MMETSP0323_2 /ASSEMBLY_ACC=CAM_ASM_000346 /LENGTH=159 /DNA_ID=CAMNT_0039667893 /DNA_START=311 /DNA_END=790 /DNA_ORIENTATION=+
METDEAEDEALQVLNQIVEDSQTLLVLGGLHVGERSDLGGGEGDVLLAANHLQLLATHSVRGWPVLVVFLQDFAIFDGLSQLRHHSRRDVSFLSNHNVVLVVRVVRISQSAVGPELELQELVTELALVANVVADVKFFLLSWHVVEAVQSEAAWCSGGS